MATPFTDMETGLWAHFNANAAYTALGLTEYRTYDGNVYPWDTEGDAKSKAKLPVIIGELVEAGIIDRTAAGIQMQTVIQFTVVYAVQSGAQSRAALEAGVAVILDLLTEPQNRPEDTSADIWETSFTTPVMVPERSGETGNVYQWRAAFQVTLTAERKFLEAA